MGGLASGLAGASPPAPPPCSSHVAFAFLCPGFGAASPFLAEASATAAQPSVPPRPRERRRPYAEDSAASIGWAAVIAAPVGFAALAFGSSQRRAALRLRNQTASMPFRLRRVALGAASAAAADDGRENADVTAMVNELRGLGADGRGAAAAETEAEQDLPFEDNGFEEGEYGEEDEEEEVDVRFVERSGMVCVLGVPNSGKSSLVNALVGSKVSIVSPKPQTTRQKCLGLALLSPRPGTPPTTQACFVDTAGIMALSKKPADLMRPHRKKQSKQIFMHNRLHKAMVKTAWKATRDVDALWWVLDGYKCFLYGDYMPECAELDGIQVGPSIRDPWWTHPELEEELGFLRRIKKMKKPVHVVLNKMDMLLEEEEDIDLEEFAISMRERLLADLGRGEKGEDGEEGEVLLQKMWPTSVLRDPDSLVPLRTWLCENLPKQSTLFPVAAVSDIPARVVASEITREKLFEVLREELPYATTVVNAVWRESKVDGKLQLGQKVVVQTEGQSRIVKGWLRRIVEDAEQEISERVNFGRPVELHFQVVVEKNWQDNPEYYNDVKGLLLGDSLPYPDK